MTRITNEYVQEEKEEKGKKKCHTVQECSFVAWQAGEGIQNAVIPPVTTRRRWCPARAP